MGRLVFSAIRVRVRVCDTTTTTRGGRGSPPSRSGDEPGRRRKAPQEPVEDRTKIHGRSIRASGGGGGQVPRTKPLASLRPVRYTLCTTHYVEHMNADWP